MKYSIYQIRLTNLERDVINGMENPHTDHPKFKAYHDAHAENFDKAKGFYEKVAEIEATDLENVFHVSNSGQSEENITRLAPMHSISTAPVYSTAWLALVLMKYRISFNDVQGSIRKGRSFPHLKVWQLRESY